MKYTLIYIFTFFILSSESSAQVKQVCPEAKINTDSVDPVQVFERFQSQCREYESDGLVNHLNDILQVVSKYTDDKDTFELGMDEDLGKLMKKLSSLKNDSLKSEMNLTSPLSKIDIIGNNIIEEFVKVKAMKNESIVVGRNGVKVHESKLLNDLAFIESCAKIKKWEKEYIDYSLKLINSTKKGKEIINCYNNISSEHKKQLVKGALPKPRLVEGEYCDTANPAALSSGGVFQTNCTHEAPYKGDPKLSMNLSVISAARTPIVLAHEMQHGCDSAKLIEQSQNVLKYRNSIDQRIKSNKPIMMIYKKIYPEREAFSFPSIYDFKSLHGFVKNNQLERLSPEVKKRALIYKNLSDIEKKQLYEFIKENEDGLKKMEKEEAVYAAQTEIEAHYTEESIFKELASKDPYLCKATRVTNSRWGPIVTSIEDEFYTAEQAGVAKEILRVYSIKNAGINAEYIYKLKEDCKSVKFSMMPSYGDGRNCILFDNEGKPVLNEELATALKSKNINY